MFLSMSGCDNQLLKLPFFVPAENTEDPRCWVDADGWHGAWGCPCPSSPGGELRLGHKAVFLWCPADILSTSHGQISLLIPYLGPSSTRHSLQVCALSSCGHSCSLAGTSPCQDCAGSCPCEDHVCGGGEQPKARKQEKKKLYQTEREKSKEEALKGDI